jgi:Glyoxalase-like domain
VPEGKVVKNRLHLDIRVSDREAPLQARRASVDAEVERLRGLGATVMRVLAEPGVDHYGVTMHDPEGNEFCVA